MVVVAFAVVFSTAFALLFMCAAKKKAQPTNVNTKPTENAKQKPSRAACRPTAPKRNPNVRPMILAKTPATEYNEYENEDEPVSPLITIVKQPDGTFKQVSAKKNVPSSSEESTEKLSKDETIEKSVEKEHEVDAPVAEKPENSAAV